MWLVVRGGEKGEEEGSVIRNRKKVGCVVTELARRGPLLWVIRGRCTQSACVSCVFMYIHLCHSGAICRSVVLRNGVPLLSQRKSSRFVHQGVL